MNDAKTQQLENELRERVNVYLGSKSKQRRTLVSTCRNLHGCQTPQFLFGGTLRDLMLQRRGALPRDLDIVVAQIDREKFERKFASSIRRRTRFGGYHLNVRGWKFDMWPLAETWAFREGVVREISFESLPRTTFLNIEAIVVRIDTTRFEKREMYFQGFFDALLSKTLEINMEDNPFPDLCVLRSLTMAAKLNFSIGPRLAKYILEHTNFTSPQHLCEMQWSHYKRATYSESDFDGWLRIIRQKATSGETKINLPIRPIQQELLPAEISLPKQKLIRVARKKMQVLRSRHLWEH